MRTVRAVPRARSESSSPIGRWRHAGLYGDLRAMPRPVWVLAAGSFVNRSGTLVVPFLVLCLGARGYTAADAGVALAAYGIGKVAAAPCGGYLADRLGARGATAISMFAGAASMLALWWAIETGADSVHVSCLLAGWASELYRPSVSTLIAASVPTRASRVTAFALYQLGVTVGLALGPVLGGSSPGTPSRRCSSATLRRPPSGGSCH
jgi:predicted MFS family arabinose efflux permease